MTDVGRGAPVCRIQIVATDLQPQRYFSTGDGRGSCTVTLSRGARTATFAFDHLDLVQHTEFTLSRPASAEPFTFDDAAHLVDVMLAAACEPGAGDPADRGDWSDRTWQHELPRSWVLIVRRQYRPNRQRLPRLRVGRYRRGLRTACRWRHHTIEVWLHPRRVVA